MILSLFHRLVHPKAQPVLIEFGFTVSRGWILEEGTGVFSNYVRVAFGPWFLSGHWVDRSLHRIQPYGPQKG